MNEYICGPVITSATGDEALQEVIPITKLISEISISESIICIPRDSVGSGFVIGCLIASIILFPIFGFLLGKYTKSYESNMRDSHD